MLTIGNNAQILSSKASVNATIGQRVAALRKAARELDELKKMMDQFSDAQLVSLGFGDGNNGTDNEVSYGIRDPLNAGADIYAVLNGAAITTALPHDYDAQLRYVAGAQG